MKVLVAGEDQRILISLRDSLRKDGHVISVARGGGRAIEMAVTEAPDVIVLDEDISVVPFERIVQILRNNPKTEETPFIFIVRDKARIEAIKSVHDKWVKKDGNVVAGVRQKVEEISEKIERDEEAVAGEKEIEGKLEQMSLIDLLQILTINRRDGTILVENAENGEKGFVYLEKGYIINAMLGRIEGEKALFRLLKWKKGRFEFIPGRPISPVHIKTSPDNLLMEAMRQMDEYEKRKTALPTLNDHVRLVKPLHELDETLKPITKEVLLLAEFYTRVEDIMENCTYPDYEVLVTIKALIDRGILSLMKPIRETGKRRDELIPPDVMLKYMERMESIKQDFIFVGKPRVLLIPNERDDKIIFVDILKTFDRFTIEIQGLESEPHAFGSVGRYAPSESFEVEFFTLPTGSTMKPLWHFLSGDTLGAIVIFHPSRGFNVCEDVIEMVNFYRRKVYRPVFYTLLDETFKKNKAHENLIEECVQKLREVFDEDEIHLVNIHRPSSITEFMKSFFTRTMT